MFIPVTTDISDGSPMIFEDFVDMLRELFASLFGQCGNRDANQTAVILRIQTEVGCANGFLDRADERYVVRLNSDECRFRSAELGDLVYWSGDTVVVDLNVIEDRDRRAAGSYRGQFLPDIVDGLLHSFANLRNLVFDSHKSPSRTVRSINQCSDLFSLDHSSNITVRSDIEDNDRNFIIHTKRNRGAVHDGETLSQNLHVIDFRKTLRIRDFDRICAVNAVDLRRFQDDVGLDFHGAQRGSRIG